MENRWKWLHHGSDNQELTVISSSVKNATNTQIMHHKHFGEKSMQNSNGWGLQNQCKKTLIEKDFVSSVKTINL